YVQQDRFFRYSRSRDYDGVYEAYLERKQSAEKRARFLRAINPFRCFQALFPRRGSQPSL
ncbi:MAG: hypothetical protein AAF202_06895, partial [Pseudomonadota bacterium]